MIGGHQFAPRSRVIHPRRNHESSRRPAGTLATGERSPPSTVRTRAIKLAAPLPARMGRGCHPVPPRGDREERVDDRVVVISAATGNSRLRRFSLTLHRLGDGRRTAQVLNERTSRCDPGMRASRHGMFEALRQFDRKPQSRPPCNRTDKP